MLEMHQARRKTCGLDRNRQLPTLNLKTGSSTRRGSDLVAVERHQIGSKSLGCLSVGGEQKNDEIVTSCLMNLDAIFFSLYIVACTWLWSGNARGRLIIDDLPRPPSTPPPDCARYLVPQRGA